MSDQYNHTKTGWGGMCIHGDYSQACEICNKPPKTAEEIKAKNDAMIDAFIRLYDGLNQR